MTAKIISGSEVAKEIREELKQEVADLKERHNIVPGLVTILVGEDPASVSYVTAKQRTSHELGFYSEQDNQPADMAEDDLLKLIDQYNGDPKIHGILVQLPLPKKIDQEKILSTISIEKDVDCLHPLNLGKLLTNQEMFVPCTPKGVIRLLDEYNIELKGKDVVIINRSIVVGKPLILLMLKRNATITVCHTKTKDIPGKTRIADIIVTAVGVPNFIKKDMVKKGCVVIDVGISKQNGKVVGDVDFDNVKKVAGYLTPMPGGIGPMTVAMLMENVLEAYKRLA